MMMWPEQRAAGGDISEVKVAPVDERFGNLKGEERSRSSPSIDLSCRKEAGERTGLKIESDGEES